MKQDEYAEMLVQHGVKATANRIVVARTLAQSGQPLTLSELERQLLTIDKSVIFRALTLFREHHLVHTIDDGTGGTRYELCHSHSHVEDDDLHLHFVCEHCQRTYCLTDLAIPEIHLPPDFVVLSANFVVRGICPHCSGK